MIQLSPYIDRDSRIHMDEELVRKSMFCTRRVFINAINELFNTTYKGKRLLGFKDGYYVSNFHVWSNGETTYQKSIPVLFSPQFQELDLNEMRLFLYVLTSSVHNQFSKVYVENLYNNTLHNGVSGLRVHDAFKRMAKDLLSLIDRGLIQVRLYNDARMILDPKDPSYQKIFYEYCGLINNRKSRTGKLKKRKHLIGIRIHPDVFNKPAVNNIASEMEFRSLADRYHIFHEDLKKETIDFIIGKKNSLVDQFGEFGLHIYRRSLEKYFSDYKADVLYHDHLNKAANHFSDFYLMEEIKNTIVDILKRITKDGVVADPLQSFQHTEEKPNISKLIEYFIANSSDEHKILINLDIKSIDDANRYMDPLYPEAQEPWTDLYEAIRNTYHHYQLKIRKEYVNEIHSKGFSAPDILDKLDVIELIESRAKAAALSTERRLEEETRKLKQYIRFLSKARALRTLNKSHPIGPVINWLANDGYYDKLMGQ